MIFGDDGLSMLQAERLEALTGKRYTSDGRRCRGTTHIRVAAVTMAQRLCKHS